MEIVGYGIIFILTMVVVQMTEVAKQLRSIAKSLDVLSDSLYRKKYDDLS